MKSTNLLLITFVSLFTLMPRVMQANSLAQQVEQASAMKMFQTIDAQKVRTFSRDILTERTLDSQDIQTWEDLVTAANNRALKLLPATVTDPKGSMQVSQNDIKTLTELDSFILKTIREVAITIGFIQPDTSLSKAKTRLQKEFDRARDQNKPVLEISGKISRLVELDKPEQRAKLQKELEVTNDLIASHLKNTKDILHRAIETITRRTLPSPAWIKLLRKDETTFKDLDDEAVFKGHEQVFGRYKDAEKSKKSLDIFLTELKAKDSKTAKLSTEKFAEDLIDKLERLEYVAQQSPSTLQKIKELSPLSLSRAKVKAEAVYLKEQLRNAYPDVISQKQTYLINTTGEVAAVILLAQAGAYQSVLTKLHREITNLIKILEQ